MVKHPGYLPSHTIRAVGWSLVEAELSLNFLG